MSWLLIPNVLEDLSAWPTRWMTLCAGCSWTASRDRKLALSYTCDVLFSLVGDSYELLIKHRFASHVIQTLLSVATGTIAREVR